MRNKQNIWAVDNNIANRRAQQLNCARQLLTMTLYQLVKYNTLSKRTVDAQNSCQARHRCVRRIFAWSAHKTIILMATNTRRSLPKVIFSICNTMLLICMRQYQISKHSYFKYWNCYEFAIIFIWIRFLQSSKQNTIQT